jgi:hypothetical protein
LGSISPNFGYQFLFFLIFKHCKEEELGREKKNQKEKEKEKKRAVISYRVNRPSS